MTHFRSAAYAGTVVHKRLRPRQHAFRYRVFALALDVDEIDMLDRDMRLFSRNARNVVSFHDADVGARDGQPAGAHVRDLLDRSGLAGFGVQVTLLTYPRLVGYVFNPLSVYFCRDGAGQLGAIVYEVSNTFGERMSYLVPAEPGGGGIVAQRCGKDLYVSPFTPRRAEYGFHVLPPGERVVVGVSLREAGEPLLKTHFEGSKVELSDFAIASLVARHPLMTLKVVGAIHFEAARLWLKGVPLVHRHVSPDYSATVVATTSRELKHD
jgi:DUF1365 family protein